MIINLSKFFNVDIKVLSDACKHCSLYVYLCGEKHCNMFICQ